MNRMLKATLVLIVATSAAATASCDRFMPPEQETVLPAVDSLAGVYARSGVVGDLRYSGNVLEVVVQQPADQLRRGGPLWARVGPYIYLFTPATRTVMQENEAIAAVRTIVQVGDVEVARAMLLRDTLNQYTWPRALNAMSEAVTGGTARPTLMERLVQLGEQYTVFQYNTDYVPAR